MFKKIPSPWTMLMVLSPMLLLSVLLSGCQTQNGAASSEKNTSSQSATTAPETAPPATAETTPSPALVLANGAYRVKAGMDTPFTDSEGNVWQADQGFSGGDTTDRDADTKIEGTTDPKMFLTEHYGMDSFSCKVPNGNYTAKLYFAETFDGIAGPGQRVFSFNVQGHDFKDIDLWVRAGGPYRPYIVTQAVQITNGVFRIDFTSQIENPEINAIELIPNT